MVEPFYKNTAYWSEPCPLGWLIRTQNDYEDLHAKQAAAFATGAAIYGSADALERLQTYRDIQTISCCLVSFPGIDRIKLLCYRLDNDKGLTAANLIKLLVKICDAKDCLPEAAKLLSLDEVADVLEAKKRVAQKRKGGRGRKPDTDPKEDMHIFDGWKNSGCRSFEEYSRTCNLLTSLFGLFGMAFYC